MSNIIITTVEKSGGDLLINNVLSIPKDSIFITKRSEGFCTLTLPKKYYSDTEGFHIDSLEVHWQNVTKPTGVSDNDSLFTKLVQLKTP